MSMSRCRCPVTAGCYILLVFCSILAAQQLPSGMKLERIEAQGSLLFMPSEIAKMSGLRTGQDVDMAALQKANVTLGEWGYFSGVRFSYRYTGTNLTVVFQVEDEKKLLTYLPDNFTSIRDEEILEAIRQEYPSFGGKVPARGTANQYVEEKIEKLLKAKGSPATVTFASVLNVRSGQGQMVFRQNKEIPICAVHFQGVGSDLESDLTAVSAKLRESSYSRQSAAAFFDLTLLPAARRHGYWRLELLEARAIDDSSCSTGTTLLLRLGDGDVFSWGAAIWDGNQNQTNAMLDDLTGMRNGEIADIGKIEAGLSKVTESYRSGGFLDFSMTPRAEQDDQRRQVNYRIQLKEGAQYSMGQFLCASPVDPTSCSSIRSKWKIPAGDILSGTVFEQFKADAFADWAKQYVPKGVVLNLILQENAARRVADVVVIPQK